MPNDISMIAWLFRGLGGIVNMIEQYSAEDGRVTDHYKEELRKLVVRLSNAVENLK